MENYKQYRLQQVHRCTTDAELLSNIVLDDFSEDEDIPRDVLGLVKIGKALALMILEDSAVSDEEIFPEKFITFKYIHATYLAKFAVELKSVLENHCLPSDENPDPDSSRENQPCILKASKHCYSSALQLELMAQMVMEQQERNQIGTLFIISHGIITGVNRDQWQ